ncbi:MAG: alpha-N-arabinofuranosidase, partial [Lachnospiraceae bacterium]|nr:alpha-N-arabinofuranosidase [Lachnospiraceae bacterium]
SSLVDDKRIGSGEWTVPEVTEAVSQDEDGFITITLNNLSTSEEASVDVSLAEGGYRVVEATVVGGEIHAHNTFEAPETVTEQPFTDYTEKAYGKGLSLNLAPSSVTLLRLQKLND